MSEIIVYLEDFKYGGDGYYETIFLDFRTLDDYEQYRRSLDVEQTPGSFIQIQGYRSPRRLFRDSYYALNVEMLKQVRPQRNQESLLIGHSFNFNNYQGENSLAFHLLEVHEPLEPSKLYSTHHHTLTDLSFQENANNTELCVYDVGQANWNEIRQDGRVRIAFDIGAPINSPKAVLRQYIDNFAKQYQQDSPDLILSHWDMDHCHCLLEMTDSELSCFSRFICVDMIKSNMHKKIYDRMETVLGQNKIFCHVPVARVPKTRYPQMHQMFSKGNIVLYAGEESRNRNYAGLILFVHGNGSHALLTGDCLLCQADDVLQLLHRQLRLKNSHHIQNGHYLVVPHHGGNIKTAFRSYHIPSCITAIEAIISVDESFPLKYKHPGDEMIAYLDGIAKWRIVRTDKEGKSVVRTL